MSSSKAKGFTEIPKDREPKAKREKLISRKSDSKPVLVI